MAFFFIRQICVTVTFLLITSVGYAYEGCEAFEQCEESQKCLYCQPACSCGHVFIGAELLYWRPFQDGLNICYPTNTSNTVLPDGRIISTFEGKGRDPDFKWNPGFRIGAGYEFAGSNWDVGASWTHFDSKTHGSHFNNRLRWNIDLDLIDLIVVYQNNCSSCFNVSPYIGLRAARIDQKIHFGAFPDSTTFATTENNLVGNNNKQKFAGLGPLVGLQADVKVSGGFSVYVNGSVSWLYGRNNVRMTNSIATIDVIDFSRIRNRINSTLLAADASFGIRWQTCFCRNKQFFMQLGYEHHRYFDYNRIGKCGDLSFDGVQIGLGVGF